MANVGFAERCWEAADRDEYKAIELALWVLSPEGQKWLAEKRREREQREAA